MVGRQGGEGRGRGRKEAEWVTGAQEREGRRKKKERVEGLPPRLSPSSDSCQAALVVVQLSSSQRNAKKAKGTEATGMTVARTPCQPLARMGLVPVGPDLEARLRVFTVNIFRRRV